MRLLERGVILAAAIPAAAFLLSAPAYGVPVTIADVGDAVGICDTFAPAMEVDEIGIGPPFPSIEELAVVSVVPGIPACFATNTGGTDVLVEIVNLTGRDFSDVWYIADTATSITNFDGFVTAPCLGAPGIDCEGFKIDAVGANTPLFSESATPDGVWEAGETWGFILQDYVSPFGPASAGDFDSIGLDSFGGLLPSTGSIVAVEAAVPEPSGFVLLAAGLVGLGLRVRRRMSTTE